MISALLFRPAAVIESSKIAALANAAYRGETSRQGWTTEADLLDGLRTSAEEVQRLIEADHSVYCSACMATKSLVRFALKDMSMLRMSACL